MKTAKRIRLAENAASTEASGELAPYNVPAVDKALDILELLGDSSQGLGLTAIGEALGRSKQEIFRVLCCLQERGYLVRDDDQTYRLSTKLFEIGAKQASIQFLIAHAMPHMERLSRQLRESCHLNIVVQNRMLVVARAEGDADVLLAVRVGATFELHRRVSGLVALSHFSKARRKEYWKQSGETRDRVRTYETQIATIREQGFAAEDSPILQGVTDCVTPVLGSGDSLLGVLCISHLCRKDQPADSQSIIQAVVECARAISAEFGPRTASKADATQSHAG